MTVHQAYFTHCTREDSVSQHPGYSIRARSMDDANLLRFATANGSYELPLGLRGTMALPLKPKDAPRRLARVPTQDPRFPVALIHTAHLEVDTSDPPRPNSFFSHVLFFQALPALEALRAWGSSDLKGDHLRGAKGAKQLPPASGLRPGNVLTDELLAAFLRDTPPAADQDLATVTIPRRLADWRQRRRLLCLFVQGLQRVLEEPKGPRARLYVLAEPGLVALLLYGALRLLPPTLTAELTFSTYENSHQALRGYNLAQVVGTYVPGGEKGLSPDFMQSRGYGIDTFAGNDLSRLASPGLDPDPPASDSLSLLLDLARGNNHPRIAAGYGWANGSLWPDGEAGNEPLREARRERTRDRVEGFAGGLALLKREEQLSDKDKAKAITPEELQGLIATEPERTMVHRHENHLWEKVRDWTLEGTPQSAAFRQEFKGLLGRNVEELKKQATATLARPTAEDWLAHWERLSALVKKPRDTLHGLMQKCPDVAGPRMEVLREWFRRTDPDDVPDEIKGLLTTLGAGEFNQLGDPGIPAPCQAIALLSGLTRKISTAGPAACKAADPVYVALCQAIANEKDPNKQGSWMAALVPETKDAPKQLRRLLQSRAKVSLAELHGLLEKRGAYAYDPSWFELWLEQGELAPLLQRADSEGVTVIRESFTKLLNRSLLVKEDGKLNQLLDLLEAGKAVASDPVLDGWTTLRQHFREPRKSGKGRDAKLRKACQERTKREYPVLLQECFVEIAKEDDPNTDDDLKRLIDTFHGFQPPLEVDRGSVNTRFVSWLDVLAKGDEEAQKWGIDTYLSLPPARQWRKALLEEHASPVNKQLLPVIKQLLAKEPTMSFGKAAMWIGLFTALIAGLAVLTVWLTTYKMEAPYRAKQLQDEEKIAALQESEGKWQKQFAQVKDDLKKERNERKAGAGRLADKMTALQGDLTSAKTELGLYKDKVKPREDEITRLKGELEKERKKQGNTSKDPPEVAEAWAVPLRVKLEIAHRLVKGNEKKFDDFRKDRKTKTFEYSELDLELKKNKKPTDVEKQIQDFADAVAEFQKEQKKKGGDLRVLTARTIRGQLQEVLGKFCHMQAQLRVLDEVLRKLEIALKDEDNEDAAALAVAMMKFADEKLMPKPDTETKMFKAREAFVNKFGEDDTVKAIGAQRNVKDLVLK